MKKEVAIRKFALLSKQREDISEIGAALSTKRVSESTYDTQRCLKEIATILIARKGVDSKWRERKVRVPGYESCSRVG